MALSGTTETIEQPPCRTMRMVGMDGADARPGRAIRARHGAEPWLARASGKSTLVETAAGGPSSSCTASTHRSSTAISPVRRRRHDVQRAGEQAPTQKSFAGARSAADGRLRRAGEGVSTTRRRQQGRRRARRRINWQARQLIIAIAASCVAAGSGGLIPPTPPQVPAPTQTPPTPMPLFQVQQPQLQEQPGGEEQPGVGLT